MLMEEGLDTGDLLNCKPIKIVLSDNAIIISEKLSKLSADMLKEGIIVRELYNYGLNDFFRVSIGTDKQMNKFIKELNSVVKKNTKWQKN